jgi:hypothetical protein
VVRPEPPDDPAAAAAAADLDRLANRLRRFSAREWGRDGRIDAVRSVAAELAAVGAPGRQLPDLPPHALGDAIAVVGADALRVPHAAPAVLRVVRAALEATR